MESQFGKFQTVVGPLAQRQSQDKRERQGNIRDIAARQIESEHEQERLRLEVESLKRQMSALERQAPTAKQIYEDLYSDWEREPDPTILFIGCQRMVDKPSIQNVLNSLLEEAGITNNEVHVQGAAGALQKKWRVTFDNDDPRITRGVAGQRVEKVLEMQQEADGSWKDRFLRMPNGTNIKAFINRDHSPVQMATEMGCKRLRAVVAECLADHAVHHQKRVGIVTVDWMELVRVRCPAKGRTNLEWKDDVFTLLGIPAERKEEIKSKFQARLGQPSGTQWSI